METMALRYLNKNVLHHINMIESIKHHQARVIRADIHGVVMFDVPSETYMISCDSLEDYKRLLQDIDEIRECEVFQSWAKSYVQEKYHLIHRDTYYQAAFFKEHLSTIQSPRLEIRSLDANDILLVKKYYPANDPSYVIQRLQEGTLFGGFLNNDVIGFIGIHDEGSIGLLVVVEKYKRKGYGLALLDFIIQHYLENNRVPYSQISHTNQASILLHQKVGMEISKDVIEWLTM
ncbi:GNAT family N-acetyltransferase [Robertmurraya massiliosenegalensis]|uniref:GNAT family N-acetyltransferase n=1 Tax=Robertmurraya TaxID=2837507 RepID=UPI0039A52500